MEKKQKKWKNEKHASSLLFAGQEFGSGFSPVSLSPAEASFLKIAPEEGYTSQVRPLRRRSDENKE